MAQTRFVYFTSCVDDDAEAIEAMVDASVEVAASTFRRRCDWREATELLGYDQCPPGLRLDTDDAVRFHKSRFRGYPCYYIVHSSIEYIFVHPEHRQALMMDEKEPVS
ncbi:hypothetical protein [Thioalkalivibrio sp. ALE19]|uniref:hypothetical protein n=1 Tax=Thioalkalivibrio sp. ALE19 TaxID=1266909 RepID=UPI00040D4FC8|nr:hypothetical protein [Thioalkalivibrio sp. ALE19]